MSIFVIDRSIDVPKIYLSIHLSIHPSFDIARWPCFHEDVPLPNIAQGALFINQVKLCFHEITVPE